MDDLISIIVPVYNNAKYLEKCIKSLVSQSYKNLEIILVNDGSTDESGGICDEFAKKDLRIKVIHKQNGGVSTARNAGLDAMSARYFVFVDSDDNVYEDYVLYMYENLKSNQADLLICPLKNLSDDEYFKFEHIMDKEDALRKVLYDLTYPWAPWGKMFKSESLGCFRFTKGENMGQDFSFFYKTVLHSRKIFFAQKSFYSYNESDTSIIRSGFNQKNDSLRLVAENFISYVKENYPLLLQDAYYFKAMSLVSLILKARCVEGYEDYIRKYANELKKIGRIIYKNKNLSLKFKCKVFLHGYFYKELIYLRRIKKSICKQ